MRLITAPAKSAQVAEFLKQEILSGRLLPGNRLATVRELATKFVVSRKVIEMALDTLAGEQLITRKDRSGVFIADRRRSKSKTVALLMETNGHLYEKQTHQLITDFQQHGYMTLVVGLGQFLTWDAKRQGATLDELLERQVDILVIDGIGTFPFALLEARRERLPQVAFINRYECACDLPSLRVLADVEEGTCLAVRHLFAGGRRRVMLLQTDASGYLSVAYYPKSGHAAERRGYRRALADTGAQEMVCELRTAELAPLRTVLSTPDHPDGVVSFMDFRARDVMTLCAELGLAVPRDVAVVGFYNTPWAEMLTPSLTSVSIREELIASTLAAKLIAASAAGKRVSGETVIKPELFVRKSSVMKTSKAKRGLATMAG